MPSDDITAVVVFIVLLGMGLFGLLGAINQKLSFRLHNLFQVRRIELSRSGKRLYYYGGLLTVLVGFVWTLLLPRFYTVLYLGIIGVVSINILMNYVSHHPPINKRAE